MVVASRRALLTGNRTAVAPPPIRLPWALTENDFTALCNRCGDCIPACSNGIIVRGAGGFPRLDFQRGECTFCAACLDACRLPLFQPRTEKPFRHVMQLGATCLPRHGIDCRSCAECCEPQALRFAFNVHRLAEPQLDPERCTGCGACVAICPVDAVHPTFVEALA